MMAESQSALAASQNRLASSGEKQTIMHKIKEQKEGVQMKYTIYHGIGDLDVARLRISQMEPLMAHLVAVNTAPMAAAVAEEDPPVEEVDLTGEVVDLTKDVTNEEVDDNEVEEDVEEMYSNDVDETEA
jgi:hypothetical protein